MSATMKGDQLETRMSVLEALASDVSNTGPNMSNVSTPSQADLDDQ
jgi:hypothetical protein